jgi:AraC family transcriptional regulator
VRVTAGTFHGFERMVRRLPGADCIRVSHNPDHSIEEHRHDWPTLTIFLAGSARETFDTGEAVLDSPAVIFHPAGVSHADRTGSCGLETAGIVFDPAWLRSELPAAYLERSWIRHGGWISTWARRLFQEWSRGTSEQHVRLETVRLLQQAIADHPPRRPSWLPLVQRALHSPGGSSTAEIARQHGLNPEWLAKSYRRVLGEGIQESLRRKRIEASLALIRTTHLPLADIAALAGFCDQSHMNRCFRAVLQTTPTEFQRPASQN